MQNEENITKFLTEIKDYKRSQLIADQHLASLEGEFVPTLETEQVDAQLEGVEFCTDSHVCKLDTKTPDSEPWICKFCSQPMKGYETAHLRNYKETDSCPDCGYEEGRSEADKRYHAEFCKQFCDTCENRVAECMCNRFVGED